MGKATPNSVMCPFPHGISRFLENVTPPNHLLSVFEAYSRLWGIVAYYSGFVFLVNLGLIPDGFQSAEFSTVLNPLDFTVQDLELNPKSWFLRHINADSIGNLRLSFEDMKQTIDRLASVWDRDFRPPDNSTRQIAKASIVLVLGDWENLTEPNEVFDKTTQNLLLNKMLLEYFSQIGKQIVLEKMPVDKDKTD
jgi:hypothetical protein